MVDTYKDFKELSDTESEGTDYQIDFQDRGTDFAIIGIHGGEIEPDTEAVVRNIAGADLSYYIFLSNAERQHITSINFDESRCINLIAKSKGVVSIHGKNGEGEFVMLGGLDQNLISKTKNALTKLGFEVRPTTSTVMGIDPRNVCNRGASGQGLQIEMSRQLRKALVQDSQKMMRFSGIIREAIQ